MERTQKRISWSISRPRIFKDRFGVGGTSDNRSFLVDTGLYTPGNLKVSNLRPSSVVTYTPSEEMPRQMNRVQIVSRGEPWELTAISARSGEGGVEQIYDLLKFCGQC